MDPAGGQLLLLHELEPEIHPAAAHADRDRLHGRACGSSARTAGPRRKLFLIVSLAANLGFLGFFKYYNFLADNLALLLRRDPHSFALSIILPLGISFHTFQSMSYVVDVYRGRAGGDPQSRSTTRCSSRSSRNWWPARSCARANSSRDLYDWAAARQPKRCCAAFC